MAYQPAIMSAWLGRAWLHDFDYKVEMAGKAGFKGVEMFYEDLEHVERKTANHNEDALTPEQLLAAASHCYDACRRSGLAIIGLQSFLFYDGIKDRTQHDRLLTKIKPWLQIAKRLYTDTIQIPANFLPADQLTGGRGLQIGHRSYHIMRRRQLLRLF